MSRYFNNFGIAQYNDAFCRNIIKRSAVSRNLLKTTSLFYPHQVSHGQRVDTVSHLYYNDSFMDWLVYLANDIVDPYYEWPMTDEQFTSYIESKYGSLAQAQLKIKRYQNNWINDSSRLTIAGYQSLVSVYPINLKKYWRPVLNEYDAVVYYERKPDDTVVDTNRILSLTVSSVTGFSEGEILSQTTNGTVNAYAEIVLLTAGVTGTITIKNVAGAFNTTQPVVGFDTGTQQTPSAVTVVTENIPTAEQSYWSAVSYYDYEEYLNEKRKAIQLIGQQHAEMASNNLKSLMK